MKRLIVICTVLLAVSLSIPAHAAVPREYNGVLLGMPMDQVLSLVKQLWPGGTWLKSQDDPNAWEWEVGAQTPFEGWFKADNQLFAFRVGIEAQPSVEAIPSLMAVWGTPIQWDRFDENGYILTWADDATLATVCQTGFGASLWVENRRKHAGSPLPTELKGLRLGMTQKEAVTTLAREYGGLTPRPATQSLRENGLQERYCLDLGDLRVSYSIVEGKVAEVTVSQIGQGSASVLGPTDAFGKPLNHFDTPRQMDLWSDGKTTLCVFQDQVRVASCELYAKGLGQTQKAGAAWNTAELDTQLNGNGSIAMGLLPSLPSEKLLKMAVDVNLDEVKKAPRQYIGKLVRITARVTKVDTYDGKSVALALLKSGSKGDVPVVITQVAAGGEATPGRLAVVLGYVIGTCRTEDEAGKTREHIVIVSKIIKTKQ